MHTFLKMNNVFLLLLKYLEGISHTKLLGSTPSSELIIYIKGISAWEESASYFTSFFFLLFFLGSSISLSESGQFLLLFLFFLKYTCSAFSRSNSATSKFQTQKKSLDSMISMISAIKFLGVQMKTNPFCINAFESIFSCLKSSSFCPFLFQSMLMNKASIPFACLSSCYLHILLTLINLEQNEPYFEFSLVGGITGTNSYLHLRSPSTGLIGGPLYALDPERYFLFDERR